MVLIVDGHNLLFRMFYGIPSPIKNTKGMEMKAAVGFISSLFKYIKQFTPTSLVVVFDSESSIGDKKELYQDYKQNRKVFTDDMTDEENPFIQLPVIYKALEYLDIPFCEVKGFEADDYIASLVAKIDPSVKKIVISTDQDFLQLINEDSYLYNPRNNILYDVDTVYQKLRVYPKQIVEYKALVGDMSDNICGVKGIGKKTAEKILSYGTIEEFYNECPEDKKNEKIKQSIFENHEIIKLNKELICFKTNVDVLDASKNINHKMTSLSAIEVLRCCNVW